MLLSVVTAWDAKLCARELSTERLVFDRKEVEAHVGQLHEVDGAFSPSRWSDSGVGTGIRRPRCG